MDQKWYPKRAKTPTPPREASETRERSQTGLPWPPFGLPLDPFWPPLGSPWQTFGTPGTRLAAQASSHRLRKQPRGLPNPHFGALACMPCMFSLFAPARFPTILDHFWHPKADLLGPTTIPRDPSGTHNHPPGPSFGTPSPPLHPSASYWGPFDTLPGSGESLPGPSWDPLGPLRTTPGIPRLHLGPSGCPSWQPLVFLFGTGAGGRGRACKSI